MTPVIIKRILPVQAMSAYVDTAIDGNLAYLADMTGGGILILDIEDITNPKAVKRYSAKFPNSIEVSGDYIYTSGMLEGLFVYEK